MIQDKRRFIGMDSSSDLREVQQGMYRFALNCRVNSSDQDSGGAIENVRGNALLDFTLPAGENICIGAYEDYEQKTAIYFLYNDAGNHSILRYYPDRPTQGGLGEIALLLESSVLNFSPDHLITGVELIDDLLYFTDGYNEPRKINIAKAEKTDKAVCFHIFFGQAEPGTNDVFTTGQTFLFQAWDNTGAQSVAPVIVLTATGAYENDIFQGAKEFATSFNLAVSGFTAEACGCGVKITEDTASGLNTGGISTATISSSGLDPHLVYENIYPAIISEHHIALVKYPPHCQPTATFEEDTNREYNYLNRNVFQFQYRYVYDDNEKSTWSPISNIPLQLSNCAGEELGNSNCIDIDFTDAFITDPSILNKIIRVELGVKFGNAGELKLIETLDRCDIGKHRAFYKFYNDEILTAQPTSETSKLFDSVPLLSRSLTNTKQNQKTAERLILGGNTEGFDNVCVDASLNTSFSQDEECSGTYDVTFELIIQGFLTGDHQLVHQRAADSYAVFGGVDGPGAPGGVFISETGEYYQQWLPEGGFIGYLAGTDYKAITIQETSATATNLMNVTHVVYDSTTATDKTNIAAEAVSATPAKQVGVITGVKPGRYVLRIASHWVSAGDKLDKGTYYDLNNGLKWQNTSTYVGGVDTGGGMDLTLREIVIDLPHTAPGTVTPINVGDLLVYDMVYADPNYTTGIIQGYLFDADGSPIPNDIRDSGKRVEHKHYRWYFPGLGIARDIATDFTDHNGFYFYSSTELSSIATPPGFLRHGDFQGAGGAILKPQTQRHFLGSLKELDEGTLSTNSQEYILGNYLEESITYIPLLDYTQCNGVLIKGRVINANGQGVAGVGVVITRNGRQQLTDGDGYFSILTYQDLLVDTITRTVCFSNKSICCVKFTSGNSRSVAITNVSCGGSYNLATPYTATDLTVEAEEAGNAKAWKRGGRIQVGIVYYDDANRSGFVNTDSSLEITIPNWSDPSPGGQNRIGKYLINWEINHAPPEWATTYQWVRTRDKVYQTYLQLVADEIKYVRRWKSEQDTTAEPDVVGYDSNDYNEIYISTQSLQWYQDRFSDSLLGYEFFPGDRLRLLADDQGVYYDLFLDFTIKGERDGFLIIDSRGNMPELKPGMLFEIYNPTESDQNKEFYEFSQCFEIGSPGQPTRYHAGPTQNQITGVQPATGTFNSGNTYYRKREMYIDEGSAQITRYIEDDSVSDFYESQDECIGRINTINPDAGRLERKHAIRVSNTYRSDAKINGLSSFETLSETPLSTDIGWIEKLVWSNNTLLAIANNETVTIYVGEKILRDSSEQNLLAISDDVIGTWQVAAGGFGTFHPESVAENNGRVYWYDISKGEVLRFSRDGITPIGSDYFMERYFRDKTELMSNSSKAPGVFDFEFGEYILTLHSDDGCPETLSFYEKGNVWTSFWSFTPEYYCSVKKNNRIISFKDGKVWIHNCNDNYNSFYGLMECQQIAVVSNAEKHSSKVFTRLSIESTIKDIGGGLWTAPDIFVEREDGDDQASELAEIDFELEEGDWRAAFLFDKNTPNVNDPLLNGDELRGYAIKILLQNSNDNFVKLYAVNVYGVLSERTNR